MFKPQNSAQPMLGCKPSIKDPKDMTKKELIAEVESLRKIVKNRELKMKLVFQEGQRFRREAQQLGMKLQFEVKNNSMLVKNLNKMRQNYF